jgi:hypothetical protein
LVVEGGALRYHAVDLLKGAHDGVESLEVALALVDGRVVDARAGEGLVGRAERAEK